MSKPTALGIAHSIRLWAVGAPLNIPNTAPQYLADTLEAGFYLMIGQALDYTGRMTYCGSYAAGTAYVQGDVVESGGLWYVSTTTQTGVAPSGATWDQIPAPGGGGGVPSSRKIETVAPLSGGGDLSVDRTLSIPAATAATDGYLSKTDWAAFNGKQSAGAYLLPADIGFTIQAHSSQIDAIAALTPAAQYQVPMSGVGPGFAWGLGTLGSAAFVAIGTGAGEVAAGDHGHPGRLVQYAQTTPSTSAPTTASTTFVALAETSVFFTPLSAADPIRVKFTGSFANNTADKFVCIAIYVDGVAVPNSDRFATVPVANGHVDLSVEMWIGALSAAAHTIEIQWRVQGGTGTATLLLRHLIVEEYSA